jgi:ABC-type transporter Mla MlaB component
LPVTAAGQNGLVRDQGVRGVAEAYLRDPDGLEPGDHACLLYDSVERRDETVYRFLRRGVERGERVVYIRGEDDDHSIPSRLAAGARPGQFACLDSCDCYLRDGAFDAAFAYEGIRRTLADATADGFSVLRSAGGPPLAVTSNGGGHDVPHYERRVADLFAGGRFVAICAYDVRRTSAATLFGVVDAHPIVLYAIEGDERLRVDVVGDDVLRPVGWLDVTTLGAFVAPVAAVVDRGEDATLDLGGVEFVDVAALRLLAEAGRALVARGRALTLTRVPPSVPTMLDLLGYGPADGLVLE